LKKYDDDTYSLFDNFDGFDSDLPEYDAETDGAVFEEYDTRRISCSFTGHRDLTQDEVYAVVPKLKTTVQYLVSMGVKEFHTGGARGFDTLAATVVYDLKRMNNDIKLILELPYKNQTRGWSEKEKRFYDFLLENADDVNYYGENPQNYYQAVQSLYKRNRAMIDKSYYCVCYLVKDEGGAAYTVNYAKKRDANIINLGKD